MTFDRAADGSLARGLEAAHGRSRILHTGGDATGWTVLETLTARSAEAAHIIRRSDFAAHRLEMREGRITGLWATDADGSLVFLAARAVVLATGGLGGLYAATTNPAGARGSGLALAARAGALLRDLEFVQFHPTAIATGSDPMPLATEALRGAGATLVDERGARIMAGVAQGDLAPRDVVARTIHTALAQGRTVFLDTREAVGADFPHRFPTVHRLCREAGLDPVRQPIPCGRRRTITWVGSPWTDAAAPRWRASMPAGRWPPPVCTAPTGWPAIPCWRPSPSPAGSRATSPEPPPHLSRAPAPLPGGNRRGTVPPCAGSWSRMWASCARRTASPVP